MLFHLKGPRDLIAGLLFLVVGGGATLTAWRYPMGTALPMGPGYFPFLAGCGLTVAGIAVALRGLGARDHRVQPIHLKPLVLVLAAVALFALIGLIMNGFAYLLYLAVPGVPVFAWHLWLVSRREERRQVNVEIIATGVLSLAAPAAYWVLRDQWTTHRCHCASG